MKKRTPKLEFKGFLSFLILHEIKQKAQFGEELAKNIGARRGETLTPGTIYPALKRLKEEKLIQQFKDGRKKMYALTDEGIIELKLLYRMFGKYFIGLKGKIPTSKKKSVKKKTAKKKASVKKPSRKTKK